MEVLANLQFANQGYQYFVPGHYFGFKFIKPQNQRDLNFIYILPSRFNFVVTLYDLIVFSINSPLILVPRALFVSRAKAPPAKRNEKGSRNENIAHFRQSGNLGQEEVRA